MAEKKRQIRSDKQVGNLEKDLRASAGNYQKQRRERFPQ